MSLVFPAPATVQHQLKNMHIYPSIHPSGIEEKTPTYPMQPQHAGRARRPPALERIVRQEPMTRILRASSVLQVVMLLIRHGRDPAEDFDAVGVCLCVSDVCIVCLFVLFVTLQLVGDLGHPLVDSHDGLLELGQEDAEFVRLGCRASEGFYH